MRRGDERGAVQLVDALRKAAYIRHGKAQSYPIHEAVALVALFALAAIPLLL